MTRYPRAPSRVMRYLGHAIISYYMRYRVPWSGSLCSPCGCPVSAAVAIGPPAGADGADGAVNRRSNVCPVDLTARLRSHILRQIRQIRQIRWVWVSGCAPIFCARSARSARSTALSSSSFPFVGYLGTRSTGKIRIARASDLGPVGLSHGAGCAGRGCH